MFPWSRKDRNHDRRAADQTESEQFSTLMVSACRNAARGCSILKAGEPALPDDWDVGLLGAVRVGTPREEWPVHGDEPMVGLAQIRMDELPFVPDSLADIAYIRVWCAEQRWPQYPGELQHEFFRVAMSGVTEELKRFAAEHESELTISRSTDLDHVIVRAIRRGRRTVRFDEALLDPLIKPVRILATASVDHPGWSDMLPLKFATGTDRPRLESLGKLSHGDAVYGQIEAEAPNRETIKIGGWPSPIQGQPRFGIGHHFVMQLADVPESGIKFLDGGVLYITRNKITGAWASDWTSY